MKVAVLILAILFTELVLAAEPDIPFVKTYTSRKWVPTIVGKASGNPHTATAQMQGSSEQSSRDLPGMFSEAKEEVKEETKVFFVKPSKVREAVKSVKNAICDEVEDGSFKIWLKADADGKVLGVGASSEGGIEINVTCHKKDPVSRLGNAEK
jgi:hypothetical protein